MPLVLALINITLICRKNKDKIYYTNKTQNNIIIYGSGEFGLQLASALKFSSNYILFQKWVTTEVRYSAAANNPVNLHTNMFKI